MFKLTTAPEPEPDEKPPQFRLEFVGPPIVVAAELMIVFRSWRSVAASARIVGVRSTPVMSIVLRRRPRTVEDMLSKGVSGGDVRSGC